MSSNGAEAARAVREDRHGDYLTTLREAFAAATTATGLREHDVLVDGLRIRLCLAGDALEGMVAALRLIPAASEPADATVRVWDDVSTGTRLPGFPWTPVDIGRQGAIEGWNSTRVRAVYHGSVMEPPRYGFNAVSLYDPIRRDAFFWVTERDRVPWVEHLEPLRPAMHWLLADLGRHLLHAAAVATDAGAVILAGAGFAGKTTTAMACVDAGMQFVGDNYVVLSRHDLVHTVHSLYPNIKLRRDSLRLMPELDRSEHVSIGDRAVFDVSRRPAQLAESRQVKAVLVVRQTGGVTRTAPVAPAAAMMALAPSTIYQLPSNTGAALKPIGDLLRTVPAYALELGTNPASAPPVIAQLLETI